LRAVLKTIGELHCGHDGAVVAAGFAAFAGAGWGCCSWIPERSWSLATSSISRPSAIDTEPLTNIDSVDAALCALTAHHFLAGSFKTYGDPETGLIVVPC